MRLEPGRKLGPYEIQEAIGAGGMGEVYRAKDTRLDRTVAIKVLPDKVATNAKNRERFEREARAIAQLSHPNICTLHDVGEEDGVAFLVMEHLEGETLADRLSKSGTSTQSAVTSPQSGRPIGPRLSLERVLEYGAQIADALDAAHRRGIVHRDLKPDNIMVTRSGIKLLDFGLTKSTVDRLQDSSVGGNTNVATKMSLTGHTQIVGTLKYMAPEQLESGIVDARTDIFALGLILYELLAGRRPFGGESEAGIIAAVLEHEPEPLSSLRASVAPALDRLVRTCLAKKPDDRWQAAADIARELRGIAEDRAALRISSTGLLRRPWLPAIGVLALVGLVYAAWLQRKPHEPAKRDGLGARAQLASIHFDLPLRKTVALFAFAISPDGRKIAYVDQDATGGDHIFVRLMDSSTAHPVQDTGLAETIFWSPDGNSVGFAQGSKLYMVNVSGGSPRFLGELPNAIAGGSWGAADVILAQDSTGHLYRFAAGGQTAVPAYSDDVPRHQPVFLPDGKRFLFIVSQHENPGLYLGALDQPDAKRLADDIHFGVSLSAGHILFVAESELLARSFDSETATIGSVTLRVLQGITAEKWNARATFSASNNGILVTRSGRLVKSQLTWFDRRGKQTDTVGRPEAYENFDLSKDGNRLVLLVRAEPPGQDNVWIVDSQLKSRVLAHADSHRRLADPIWAPDGERFAIAEGRNSVVVRSVAGGEPSILHESSEGRAIYPEDWSRDGRYMAVGILGGGRKITTVLDLEDHSKAYSFGEDARHIDETHFSPDARWIAYNARYGETDEAFLGRVPYDGRRWQISASGGVQPRWRADGKELYFLSPSGAVMAVAVDTAHPKPDGAPRIGQPAFLFQGPLTGPSPSLDNFAVDPKGERFLFSVPMEEYSGRPLNVIVNWRAGLAAR